MAALPAPVAAHVRWFVPEGMQLLPPDLGLIFGWPTLAVVGASLLLFLILRQLQRLVGSPHWPNPGFLAYMEPCATALLAVHTGVSLVWFAYQPNLFVPQLLLPADLLGISWRVSSYLWPSPSLRVIKGLFDRARAVLLIVAFLLGSLVCPPLAMLDQLHYAGIAVALFVLGRTVPPEWVASKLAWLSRYETPAVVARRVLTGLSLVMAGFNEKLLAPELGRTFLAEYPQLLLYGSGIPLRAAARLLQPAVRGEIEEARRPGNDGVGAP